MGEDELAHLRVILAQHRHQLLGLGRLGERGEAPEVEEHDDDLAPVGLQRVLGAAGHDQLGELRREEALEPAELLHLGDLLLHALLEQTVPLRQLAGVLPLEVPQALLLQARAHSRAQEHHVEGLGEIVLRTQLDARCPSRRAPRS